MDVHWVKVSFPNFLTRENLIGLDYESVSNIHVRQLH